MSNEGSECQHNFFEPYSGSMVIGSGLEEHYTIILEWIVAQHEHIVDWTARVFDLEEWEPLSNQKKHAMSAIEVFRILEEKVPYQFSMVHLPNRRIEVVLRNLKGLVWIVNSIPSTRVQTLHTFCGGWMAFVRGNDIQLGDIFIFELVSKYEMRVHISGAGRKELDCLVQKQPLMD